MLRLLALLLVSELVRTGFFVSVLPVAGRELHLSTAVIGLMVGAHYLMDALGKGPLGLVSERYGLGRMLLLGSLLGLVAVAGVYLAPSPLWGVLGCAVWGLIFSALWPGVMSVSQSLAHPERLARALAVSNLSVAPAIVAGVLLVGPLMQANPQWAWDLLLGAQVLAVLLALSLWPLRLPTLPNDHPALNVWRGWSRVAALLPAAFAQTLAPGLLVTLFYPLLEHLGLHLRDLIAPGLLAGVAFGLSLWLVGRVADQAHPRRALTPGLLILALVFGLVALSDVPDVQPRLWFLAPLLGVGYGAFIAGWNGLVGRTLPEAHRAAAWGTVMAVESLGYAVGPILGGAIWQLSGMTGVFTLGALVFLLTEVYYLWPARSVTQSSKQVPGGHDHP